MTHERKRISPSSQSGFGLVEILITILVVSVGLLGLAALQVSGLRNNHDAYLRTVASQLAADVADRLRANIRGARDGRYNGTIDASTSVSQSCNTQSCTPEQMANYDRSQLAGMLKTASGRPMLPDGRITVTPLTYSGGGTSSGAVTEIRRFKIEVKWGAVGDHVTTEFTL